MKSIRLSLVVYFLVLVGVALGAVSVLVYRLTQNTLQAEEAKRREMHLIHYADLCRNEELKLDLMLAEQVRRLSDEILFQQSFGPFRWYQSMSMLGAASTTFANAHVGVPLWAAMARGQGYPYTLIPPTPPTIRIPEATLARLAEDSTEYWQINTSWKEVLTSESLDDLELPFDAERYARATPGTLVYDNPELASGHVVRRVVLRTPVSRFAPGRRPQRGTPGKLPLEADPGKGTPTGTAAAGSGEPGAASPNNGERRTQPAPTGTPAEPAPPPPRGTRSQVVYFSYASDTTERDEAIAALQEKRDRELEQLHAESTAALASLRDQLLTVSLIAFVLAVFGGLALVRFSLSPLQRLTDAVSRVSEKDVRLQLDDHRLPEELRPIVKRLQQSLVLLHGAVTREKQAAADISHELRTPLAALLTTTEVALRKPRSPEEYREVIQDCRSSCQQMSRLVERLLALSRLDAGVDRLRAQEVDATELVEKCAGLVRPLAEARGLTLRVHRNGPVFATLDADKLREVLNNLLHNAIEYNLPKGSVDVAVEQENGHVNLEVRDTGIGMAPDAVRHIFERFYRADSARQADSMHAGLGLAIVKGYLDLMGGTISVQSAVGQGSTFRVQLPVRPPAATGA